ncbi:MAG: AraC family transcriptional regulator [Acidobacteriota bacterium]
MNGREITPAVRPEGVMEGVQVIAGACGVRVLNLSFQVDTPSRPCLGEHSAARLAVVRQGAFSYRTGRQTHLVGPGAVILVNPGESYEILREFDSHAQSTVFEYPEAVMEQLVSRMRTGIERARGRYFAVPVLPPAPRIEALHRLVWVAIRDAGDRLRLLELLCTIAAEVSREAEAACEAQDGVTPVSRRRFARARVRDAARFIETHAKDPVTLSDVSTALQLSRFHFVRMFRQEVGLTPHQYLIRMRLRRSINLLLETALPVTEIASVAGFGDLSHLSHAFRKHVGCPPGALRLGPAALIRNGLTSSWPGLGAVSPS